MTRTAVDETKEREILRVLGRWIGEPVDSIVEAAFQDFAVVDPLSLERLKNNKVPGKDK